MLHWTISHSRRVASLSGPWPKLLYTWVIPSVDNLGRMEGSPSVVAGMIFPREEHATPPLVSEWLDELHRAGLICWYEANGDRFLVIHQHDRHQVLKGNMAKASDFPAPPDECAICTDAYSCVLSCSLEEKGREEKGRESSSSATPTRWTPAHDYASDWNAIAESHGWQPVRRMTAKRSAKLKTREGEAPWDWAAVLAALEKADHSYLASQTWWSFDWLIRNDDHYVRLLEGRYGKRGIGPKIEPSWPETPPPIPRHDEADEIWQGALEKLRAELDPHTFSIWLRPTYGAGLDPLVVAAPNKGFLDWLESNRERLERAVGRGVEFVAP